MGVKATSFNARRHPPAVGRYFCVCFFFFQHQYSRGSESPGGFPVDNEAAKPATNFFERYLTLWIGLLAVPIFIQVYF